MTPPTSSKLTFSFSLQLNPPRLKSSYKTSSDESAKWTEKVISAAAQSHGAAGGGGGGGVVSVLAQGF